MPVSIDDNIHPLIAPDETTIRAHLELLFRRVRREYPDGLCEIAWADGYGAITSGNTFPITPNGLDDAAATAARHNRSRWNVYVGVNPRTPDAPAYGRCKAIHVEIAFFQFAEVDSAEGAAALRKAPLPYTWAVTTGRVPNPRPHAYWELEEPVRNLAAWSAQQKALAAAFFGDEMSNPDRVMRLAGTVNYPNQKKVERGYRVEKVTLRYLYDDEERSPVSSTTLLRVYPWVSGNARVDPKTGEVHETSSQQQSSDKQTGPIWDAGDRIDPQSLVRNIHAGIARHDNTLSLVAHLVATGHRDWIIRELLTRILPTSEGNTLAQLPEMIRSARMKFQRPDPTPEEEEDFSAPPSETPPLILKPIGILNPSVRAPRDWLVPYRMMRRHVTMTTAAPGVGKSTLVIEEAISLASGIDFLGFGIKRPSRVAVVNNEETQDEIERRIEAACLHFDVPFDAIAQTLFVYSGVDAAKLIVARADQHGNVIPTPQADQLRALVNDLKLDLLILDPFVQMHYVEESSNEQISRALVQIRALGSGGHPAALHVVHHNRKPPAGNAHQAGDMNSARGASSMAGEAHFFFTLSDMGEEEGEKLNLPEEDRALFLRLDDAKRKMAPVTGARWFERLGVLMPYGKFGEEVGVLAPKEFEELKNNISIDSAREILQMIDKAWKDGMPYSEAAQSGARYVVSAMMRSFNMTRVAARSLARDWLQNGMIQSEEYDKRNKSRGLRVVKWPG